MRAKKKRKKLKKKKSMIINTEKCIFSYAVHSSSIALMYNTTHYTFIVEN